MGLVSFPQAVAGEPLVAPGQIAEFDCETQATQVAPEAKVSAGSFRIRLLRPADLSEATAGTWTPVAHAPAHGATLALRHREICAAGCPLHVPGNGTGLELWAPRRTSLDKVGQGEALTIAVVDGTSMAIRASTFIDNAIASLEQGQCSRLP